MHLGPQLKLISFLVFVCTSAHADDAKSQYLSSFQWDLPNDWFGGLSGLELTSDGSHMTAITDRGRVVKAKIVREAGQITDIRPDQSYPLRAYNGEELIGWTVDSEGLVVAPDGTVFVSFEGVHRVSRYPNPQSPSLGLNRPNHFKGLPGNGGFEALAMDSEGRLHTLPEDAIDENGQIPLYRWTDDYWEQPLSLPSNGRFLPVGADFGPDGRFYLLERGFNIFGFRSRVRSWKLTEAKATDERTELETETGTHDNLEGLSVWRDADGRLRLTMIADDNFFFLQDTELVEYVLHE